MTLYLRVQAAAKTADARVMLATTAIAPLYAAGWIAGRLARIAWRGLVWLYEAARLGLRDGWGG